VTLCRPLPYGLHAAPLEGGWRNPQKGYVRLPLARTGRRHDVRLVEHVSSANFGPVRPSPPLYCHPGYCGAIPSAVGAQDDETSPRPLLCFLRPSVSSTLEPAYEQRPNEKLPQRHPRSRSCTGTGLAATSRQEQDSLGRPSHLCRCTSYRHT
jgi:hypothetical protein